MTSLLSIAAAELRRGIRNRYETAFQDYLEKYFMFRKAYCTVRQLNEWMKEDFGAFNIELHYSAIKQHMITCEEYLGENITDYKFFCFNGVPKYIYVRCRYGK